MLGRSRKWHVINILRLPSRSASYSPGITGAAERCKNGVPGDELIHRPAS